MILTKTRLPSEQTEIKKFHAEFPKGKGISYRLEADTQGNIIKIETNDKKIIKFLKEMNFNEKS